MKVIETPLPGVLLIEPTVFGDEPEPGASAGTPARALLGRERG